MSSVLEFGGTSSAARLEMVRALSQGAHVQTVRSAAERLVDALADTMTDMAEPDWEPGSYRDAYRWVWRIADIALHRLDIKNPNEYRDADEYAEDYGGFRDSDMRRRARRAVRDMYKPVHDSLMAIDRRRLARHVAEVGTGWPSVDEKIKAVREQYAKADSADDWRDVGRRCDGLMEEVGRAVADALRLDLQGKSPKDAAGIATLLTDAAKGSGNARLRKLLTESSDLTASGSSFLDASATMLSDVAEVAKAADGFANHVKHAATTEHQAAIAVESSIMFASMARHAVMLIKAQDDAALQADGS